MNSKFQLGFAMDDITAELTPRSTRSNKNQRIARSKSASDGMECNEKPVLRTKTQNTKRAKDEASTSTTKEIVKAESKRKRAGAPTSKSLNQAANEIDWMKMFEPKDLLLVHPKKLDEIKDFLRLTKQSTAHNMLLLIGPSGCCKLSTIRILGTEAGYDICEFNSSADIDRELVREDVDYGASHRLDNQAERFTHFLLTASRFQSLIKSNERLMVVKDFPNAFLRKGANEEFWAILKKFKLRSKSPLVFIVTETNSKGLNLEYTLFPENIRIEFGISTINMNPIALTMTKKALKQIVETLSCNENSEIPFVQPPQDVIDSIAVQCQGDIRSAIHNLQMVCQPGIVDISVPPLAKKAGKKPTPKSRVDAGVGRDEQLNIFHALGRIMYPKRELNPQNNRMELTHQPESLAEQFSDQSGKFLELLHSNFLKNFSEINDVSVVSELLSFANVLENEYREAHQLSQINLCIATRALMVNNSGVRSGFRPITATTRRKFKSTEEKNHAKYLNQPTAFYGGHRVSKHDYFADYTFSTIIVQSQEYKQQHQLQEKTPAEESVEEPFIDENF